MLIWTEAPEEELATEEKFVAIVSDDEKEIDDFDYGDCGYVPNPEGECWPDVGVQFYRNDCIEILQLAWGSKDTFTKIITLSRTQTEQLIQALQRTLEIYDAVKEKV